MSRTVAILCAARRSVYHSLPDLEVYDEARDARTFAGGMSIVAHPPCRRWTTYGDNMTRRLKLDPAEVAAEKDLGVWCAEQVKEWGGILEQPAKSRLWAAAGLPLPGSPQSADSFSLAVWQSWWGFEARKATWLYFRGIQLETIQIPFTLLRHKQGGRKWFDSVPGHSNGRRSETTPAFAEWLVAIARSSKSPHSA